jgi:hypothetical protein
MSKYQLEPPLVARTGGVLRAIGITRISTLNQDPKSLADQQALLRQWVRDRYDGPVEWTFIAGQGSGECVDRQQVVEADELVASGTYDLVVMEDLSRHMRRVHAVLFCEACEDMETRLIAINDDIDTCKEWRLHAFFAAMKHEQSNKDTSLRIKRSLRNRFLQGEVVQCPIYGYIKPQGAKNDGHLQKDSAAEPVYQEWFRKLNEGAVFSEIADWLNASGVPIGPYCRAHEWTGPMVGRITRTPILKGIRVRNNRKSKRINKTGKYKSIKARPEERLERYCPHLAFFEPAYYDRVLAKVNARNAKYRPGGVDGPDVRQNIPKKRTRYPGQSIHCGICGRLFVFGAHGQSDHLMCRGSREYWCWNSLSVDGPLAAQRISGAVLSQIEMMEGFDPAFSELIRDEARRQNLAKTTRLQELDLLIDQRQREIQNLIRFIRGGGESPSVQTELRKLESELDGYRVGKEELEDNTDNSLVIPSVDEIKVLARNELQGPAIESFEFAGLMRRIIKELHVFPYRLCDGKDFVLRARFRLQLANLLPEKRLQDAMRQPLERLVTVDLFTPPGRVEYRQQVVELRNGGTERAAAERLGITVTAAQRAAGLDRLMQQLNLADPYVPLREPPMDYPKMRRPRHLRYRFDPLPGYPIN